MIIINQFKQKIHPQESKLIYQITLFKPDFNLDIYLFQTQDILIRQTNDSWRVWYQKYQKNKWENVLDHIALDQNHQIQPNKHQYQSIQSPILVWNFSMLKSLSLRGCRIDNIENLITTNLSPLQNLYIDHNQITRISALNKLSNSLIQNICLCGNPIIQINSLARSKMNTYKMERLMFQLNIPQLPMGQDLSLVVKYNFKTLDFLHVRSNQRIRQYQKVFDMLKLRYPAIVFQHQDYVYVPDPAYERIDQLIN